MNWCCLSVRYSFTSMKSWLTFSSCLPVTLRKTFFVKESLQKCYSGCFSYKLPIVKIWYLIIQATELCWIKCRYLLGVFRSVSPKSSSSYVRVLQIPVTAAGGNVSLFITKMFLLCASQFKVMKKLVTVIVYALVYVLFHLSTIHMKADLTRHIIPYVYTIGSRQLKRINLKNGRNFHPGNKRPAPIRGLPRLKAETIRPSLK